MQKNIPRIRRAIHVQAVTRFVCQTNIYKRKKKTLLLSVISTITTMNVQLLNWNLNKKLQKCVGQLGVDKCIHVCVYESLPVHRPRRLTENGISAIRKRADNVCVVRVLTSTSRRVMQHYNTGG